jgi:hypothetical protein
VPAVPKFHICWVVLIKEFRAENGRRKKLFGIKLNRSEGMGRDNDKSQSIKLKGVLKATLYSS